jgi:hypothetical protein
VPCHEGLSYHWPLWTNRWSPIPPPHTRAARNALYYANGPSHPSTERVPGLPRWSFGCLMPGKSKAVATRLGLRYTRESDSVLTLSWSIDLNGPKRLIEGLRRLPSRLDKYLLSVILLPLIILLLDSNVFFSKAGWLDSWYYYSYFRHLNEFKSVLFPNTYYGSRMSWILPGYLVNRVFSPLPANYILHLGTYYIGAVSLYFLLKTFYSRATASLVVITFTCNPYLWTAVGTDYVDGFGIGCYLLALAILARIGSADRSRLRLSLTGAACAAVIYTNTVWLLFSPALFFFYLFLRRPTGPSNLFKAAIHFVIWFGAGAAALTVVLGVFNYGIDGNFWFYLPSILFTLQNADKTQPWHSADYEWVKHAHWLIYAAITMLAVIASRLREVAKGKPDTTPAAGFFRWHFFSLSLIFVLLELKGMYMLEWAFYASYLIPATFLVVGSTLLDIDKESKPFLIVSAAAVILILPWSGTVLPVWTALSKMSSLLLFSVAATAILLRAILPGNRFSLATCLIGFALLNFYIRGVTGQSGEQAGRPHGARDAFVRMTRSVDVIDQERQGGQLLFWYDTRDPHLDEFDSINSFFLWGYTWMGRAFPAIDPVANERVTPGRMIAVLSSKGDSGTLLEQANRALKPRGLAVTGRARREIEYGSVHYSITCMYLVRDPDQLRPLAVSFNEKTGEGMLFAVADRDQASAFPLDKWRTADHDAVVQRTGSELRVQTGFVSRVSYGAIYAPLVAPADGRYIFTLKYRLLDGHIAFGALNENRNWLGQVGDTPTGGPDSILEYVVDLRKGQKFMMLTTNNRPSGSRFSSFILREMKAFQWVKALPSSF